MTLSPQPGGGVGARGRAGGVRPRVGGSIVRSAMVAAHQGGPITRFGSQFLVDAIAWVLAIVGAAILRYEFAIERVQWMPLLVTAGAVVVTHGAFGALLHLYRGRHPYGSFAEVRTVVVVAVLTAIVISTPVAVWGLQWDVPRSTVLLALPIALVGMGTGRFLKRSLLDDGVEYEGAVEPALVYGAGYLGASVVRRLLTDPASPYFPVGLVDDDPRKARLWLDNVPVMGGLQELDRIVSATGATVLIVTIARADAALMSAVADAASAAGIAVKVLPGLSEILAGRSRLRDLRDLSIEDIIGRHPVDTDLDAVADRIRDRRVLVTGAGGSIGAELCRQIAALGPRELIMLDRDETALQSVQLDISGNGLLMGREVVLADIRDAEAMSAIMAERRPHVVFHAAALKHLPMLEQYPMEAWKTNVLGTLAVLEAAESAGVEIFVNISTDKAAEPTSVLGRSKLIAERLTAHRARRTGRNYVSVRFGNVLGSRGSMLPTFAALIERGGPVTVTHPDATRYFMTIPEACQLVLQAAVIGAGGEALILDMGRPVRILDIAQRMIEMSGRDIAIAFTGLRPGEKIHEDLVSVGEKVEHREHPAISHTVVEPLPPEALDPAEFVDGRAVSAAEPRDGQRS